ncbi:MAG TPA: serine/threonine-protein kinase [Kofleriaceae bacterium]|nr:serine/threonine-protein kinase [Kofleriaceae bacterium]
MSATTERDRPQQTAAPTVDLGPDGDAAVDGPPPPRFASAFDPHHDRFERLGELGRGGMGRVDDAYDRALGRPVAIKHILSASDVDLVRFEREARITARLEHPGIVPVHDAGRGPDGTPYYVMRRVDGRPLSELVGAKKTLAGRMTLLPNVLAACDAIAYAHARGVVHRDLKPSNILIGPFGETLVIDWGLAREANDAERPDAPIPPSDAQLTRAGTVAGTPGFMAPEQARGEPVDARADVFALGATLFYVLAGDLPYDTASATEMVSLAGSGRSPDWAKLPDELPRDLRAIITKAMATSAAERYRDGGALASDLRRFMDGQLVAAHDYGAFARILRFVRRHRATVAVAAVSAAALAVVGTLAVRRVVAERDDANAQRAIAEARQREATAMADRLLVEHARELVGRDPTEAIQELRNLRPESQLWPQAATVAQAAALSGIPFGFSGLNGDRLRIAPDDRHVALAGVIDDRISLVDLVTRTNAVIAHVPRVRGYGWLDASRHLVLASQSHLIELDVQTGATRERDLGEDIEEVAADGSGALWVQLGRRLYQLASFDAAPVELATDTAELAQTELVAVTREKDGMHVVNRRASWLLPGLSPVAAVLIDNGGLVAIGEHEVDAWQLPDRAAPVKLGHWKLPEIAINAGVHDDVVMVATAQGLRQLSRIGEIALGPEMYSTIAVNPARDLFATSAVNGQVYLIDHDARWLLAPRPFTFQRMAFTHDGRFLMGVGADGSMLVWDLPSFAPRIRTITRSQELVDTTRDALWLIDMPDYVTERDRTTDVATPRLHIWPPMISGLAVDPSGTHALVTTFGSDNTQPTYTVMLFDLLTKKLLARAPDESTPFGFDEQGVVVAFRDGRVADWPFREPFAERTIAQVDREPDAVAREGRYLFASYSDGRLVRVDLGTGAQAHDKLPAAPDQLLVDPHGYALVLAGGTVWRWDGSTPPVKQDVIGSVIALRRTAAGVIARTATAVVVIDPVTRVLPLTGDDSARGRLKLGSRQDSDWVVTTDQVGLEIANVRSGIGFSVPCVEDPESVLVEQDGVFASMIGGEKQLFEWKLDVPTDPVALRTWLATVTNAVRTPGSEVVVWP